MKRRVFAYVCLAQRCSMFEYISYMLLYVLYTFVFTEKLLHFLKERDEGSHDIFNMFLQRISFN